MVVRVVNNREEEMNTKMKQKENPKLINRRTSGQERKQRTDLFFINKALQKNAVFEMTQIICSRKD